MSVQHRAAFEHADLELIHYLRFPETTFVDGD